MNLLSLSSIHFFCSPEFPSGSLRNSLADVSKFETVQPTPLTNVNQTVHRMYALMTSNRTICAKATGAAYVNLSPLPSAPTTPPADPASESLGLPTLFHHHWQPDPPDHHGYAGPPNKLRRRSKKSPSSRSTEENANGSFYSKDAAAKAAVAPDANSDRRSNPGLVLFHVAL